MLKKAIRWGYRPVLRRIRKTGVPANARDEGGWPWNRDFNRLLAAGEGNFRSNYTWGVLQGAKLAKGLGYRRISVMELGVAGGGGLLSLEAIAEKVENLCQVGIDVYGFDSGQGLPPPEDYRDLPNLYREGDYLMETDMLRSRLKRASLNLGLIEHTIPDFIRSQPAPVAFISFDLDLYSSTMESFKLLEADQDILLPRIHCYFDDIMGLSCSEYTGERLAIAEFNAHHFMRKISPIYGLRYYLPKHFRQRPWPDMFYLAHIFDHALSSRDDGSILVRSRDLE